LPGTGVTPSAWNTRTDRICGVAAHMPPVVPVGSLSTSVAFHASVLPVFCTLSVNRPNCPRYMVVGPPLVIVTAETGTVTVCASWQSSTPGVPLVSVQV